MENNNNENEEVLQIDFLEIFNTLLRNIWIIVLAGVCCMAAAVIYTAFCVEPTYTSSLSFYVRNSEMQGSITSISSSEINSSIQLAKTYTVILQDDSILEKIGTDLIEEFGVERVSQYYEIVETESYDETGESETVLTVNAKQLSGQISIEPINETEILSVTAVTRDPEFSAAVCRSLEEIAPDELKRIVGIDYIESIGEAKVPRGPSGPNVKKNGALGLILGVFVSGFIIVLLSLLDNKIYSSDYIRDNFETVVFGEIPYYEFNG